jgi:hypothetical protein
MCPIYGRSRSARNYFFADDESSRNVKLGEEIPCTSQETCHGLGLPIASDEPDREATEIKLSDRSSPKFGDHMSFISSKTLSEYQQRMTKSESSIRLANSSARFVFLSHSSLDAMYVKGAAEFLSSFNIQVYVDLNDQRMPKPPSPQTAEILRAEIRRSHRFVIFLSSNSASSKWIPWELGIADAFKGTKKVALLPMSFDGSEGSWAKQEYLGLYPRVVGSDTFGRQDWYVQDPNDSSKTALSQWLA